VAYSFLGHPVGAYSFFFVFGLFNKVTAYTFERILTQNTSHDVVPGNEL